MTERDTTKPQPSKIAKKREAMRTTVLAAAAVQMNQRGAASLDLKALGQAVDLSRNSLYHYFKNRRDLAFRCYLQAAHYLQEDLTAALNSDAGATAQLQLFLTLALVKRRHETAVLSDLHALDADQRYQVLAVQQDNLAMLNEFFSAGVTAGEFRPHNPEVAAQSLLGIMSWARLWFRWAGRYRSGTSRFLAKTADGIADSFLFGLAAHRNYVDPEPLKLKSVTAKDFDLFDSQHVSEEKRLQLIGAASRIFNRKGIAATSIDEIAAEVGATKGAIYHYFDDKEQLLDACYERAFDLYELFNRAGEARGEGSLLAVATPLHLNCQAQASRYPPLILQAGIGALPKHIADRAAASSRRLHRTRRAAIRRGECREGGALMIELSAGSFFWVQRWLADNPHNSMEHLADDVCAIVINGIAA